MQRALDFTSLVRLGGRMRRCRPMG
jgi:hypothetical protein